MSFSETILLPREVTVPENVVFYKRIDDEMELMGKNIMVYSNTVKPFIEKVTDCRVYPEFFTCYLRTNSVDTNANMLAEADKVDKPIYIRMDHIHVENITDDVENRLIQ